MFDDDLPTGLWVQAHLARCNAQGTPVYVVRRGDPQTGMVLLKVVVGRAARVFTRTRDPQGRLGWLPGLNGEAVIEPDADAFIERAVKRDPDLWVLEVESRDGSHPFEGKVF